MTSFSGRKLDLTWFIFFVFHFPISVLFDAQVIYPQFMLNLLSSTPFPGIVDDYLASTRDVILLGARDGGAECGWMRILLMMEAYVQAPFFVIGAIALFRNDKRIYPWMVAYGATTVTAVIPTLAAVFTTPVKPPLTTAEILKFLVAYVPFLLIPFSIMVDMGMRCVRLINLAEERKMA